MQHTHDHVSHRICSIILENVFLHSKQPKNVEEFPVNLKEFLFLFCFFKIFQNIQRSTSLDKAGQCFIICICVNKYPCLQTNVYMPIFNPGVKIPHASWLCRFLPVALPSHVSRARSHRDGTVLLCIKPLVVWPVELECCPKKLLLLCRLQGTRPSSNTQKWSGVKILLSSSSLLLLAVCWPCRLSWLHSLLMHCVTVC